MSSAGSNTNTLSCQRCDKHFTRPENLARHMKTHNTFQKHQCQTCGRQFTRSDLRKKHELLHGRSTPASTVSKTQRRRTFNSKSPCKASPLSTTQDSIVNTSTLADRNVALMMSAEDSSASRQGQAESLELDQNFMHGSWADPTDINPYFDYKTFARPWNYHLDQSADTSDWFSSQFFAALRETDLAFSPPFQTWSTAEYGVDFLGVLDHNGAVHSFDVSLGEDASSLSGVDELSQSVQAGPQMNDSAQDLSGRASRVSSPPNESSHEDRLPFAWDPRSKRIVRAKPIVLPLDDPIFANLDQTVKLSQATLSRIGAFLRPLRSSSDEDTFTLPELSLVNVFIGLFFNKFLPQAPVLHRQTINVESLPPALLAIMMVIGSCYSRLRHTRRFGIIVFDRTRQNLLASIENNNSLMREPLVIYAIALICYMGLWCGNKRAFELSEALRAVAVTYIRRLPSGNIHWYHETNKDHHGETSGNDSSGPDFKSPATLQSQWLAWATQESQKRLRWFVYMIDSQFPAILGMSGMLTWADIRKWECPCDEDFWMVTTARSWKNRLGSASEPSCPVFGSLTALLLSKSNRSNKTELLPGVNTWSANLILTAIMSEVFHYQETLVVLRAYQDDSPAYMEASDMSSHAARSLDMLDIWHRSYGEHQIGRPDVNSAHLQRCSAIIYHLARLYLVFPVSDIQDCLGRSGPADSKAAMDRLGAWIAQCPGQATLALEHASICISVVLANTGESNPYDLIGLFLCHVIIWSFAHIAPLHHKKTMIHQLHGNQRILQSVVEAIEAGLLPSESGNNTVLDAPQLIFRHAIQSLVQLGTWGASSNLALLLHLHPDVAR